MDPAVISEITQVYDGIVSSFLKNSEYMNEDQVINELMSIKPFIDDLGIDTVGRVVEQYAVEKRHKDIVPALKSLNPSENKKEDHHHHHKENKHDNGPQQMETKQEAQIPENQSAEPPQTGQAPLNFVPDDSAKKAANDKEKKKKSGEKKGFFSKLFGKKKSHSREKKEGSALTDTNNGKSEKESGEKEKVAEKEKEVVKDKNKDKKKEKENNKGHHKKGGDAQPPANENTENTQTNPTVEIQPMPGAPQPESSINEDPSVLQPSESYVSRAQMDAILAERVRKAEEEMNRKYDFTKEEP